MTQAAVIPPTLCPYVSPEDQPVFLCTQIGGDGVTWYWDATITNPGGTPEVAAGWTTNNAALCKETTSQEIFPGPFRPILDILYPPSE